MPGIRYSLLTLLGATALVATAIVALRSGDWFWCRLLFTLTLTLNLAALLGAINQSGRRRAFWIGFALFGWTCWAIANLSFLQIAEYQIFARQTYDMLREYVPEGSDGTVVDTGGSRISLFSFRQILHSIFGLLFSLLGGIIGLWFFSKRHAGAKPNRDTETPESISK